MDRKKMTEIVGVEMVQRGGFFCFFIGVCPLRL